MNSTTICPSEAEQRTDAWFAQRLGKVTASRFSDVLARTKSGPAASRQNYLMQLVCERLTGRKEEQYVSPAMQWGIDHEEEARTAYAWLRDAEVSECGFLLSSESPSVGGSPDGLVGDDGIIEIKCPLTATHISTLRHGMPPKHHAQVQGLLWVTGRQWADFVSFDPRLPPGLSMHVQRVERNAEYIESLRESLLEFVAELDAVTDELRAKAGESLVVPTREEEPSDA